MSQPDHHQQSLETLLADAKSLKIELEEALLVETNPVEQRKLKRQIKKTTADIAALEAQQGPGGSTGVARYTCPEPPREPEHFGGRDAELQTLKDKLKADDLVAITSLQGLGGIGK